MLYDRYGRVLSRDDDFSAVDVSQVDFTATDFRGRDLRGVDLRGANLEKARLQGVKIDGDIIQCDLFRVIVHKGWVFMGCRWFNPQEIERYSAEDFDRIALENTDEKTPARVREWWKRHRDNVISAARSLNYGN